MLPSLSSFLCHTSKYSPRLIVLAHPQFIDPLRADVHLNYTQYFTFTTQRTQPLSIAKTSCLMKCRTAIAVYRDRHMEHVNSRELFYVDKMVHYMVGLVTLGL